MSNIKNHKHLQSTSNAAAASDLWENEKIDAAVSTPNITDHYMVKVIAKICIGLTPESIR